MISRTKLKQSPILLNPTHRRINRNYNIQAKYQHNNHNNAYREP